jgi:hypothetical protein
MSSPARSTINFVSDVCIRMVMIFPLYSGFARVEFVRSRATSSNMQKRHPSLADSSTALAVPWVKNHDSSGPGMVIVSHNPQRPEKSDRRDSGTAFSFASAFASDRLTIEENIFRRRADAGCHLIWSFHRTWRLPEQIRTILPKQAKHW